MWGGQFCPQPAFSRPLWWAARKGCSHDWRPHAARLKCLHYKDYQDNVLVLRADE